MPQGTPVRLVIRVLVLVAVAASGSGAQTIASHADSMTNDTVPHSAPARRPEIGRNTRVMVLGTATAGAAIAFFDSRLSLDAQHVGDDMSVPSAIGSFVGGPVPLALGATLYAAGRGTGDRFVTRTGREVIRAVLVSGSITALAKGTVGRARPSAAPGDPDEFRPGRGFLNGSLASFPSGHTSAAFATATVLARELHATHPGVRWWVDPLLFGGASFVGYSRVYQQQHWPSDVIAGAALGGITGFEVVAHARGDRSPLDRRLFSHVSIGPSLHGASIQWSRR